jgi:hypothetical protein
MVSTNGRFFNPTDAALRSLAFGDGGKGWKSWHQDAPGWMFTAR